MNILSKKIGIIGGGQLGKMMILDAKRLGFYCATLDPTEHCPSHSISDTHIIAPFDDRDALRQLAEMTDVLTYEFEHIDAEFLNILEDEGFSIYPSPKSLIKIQDKYQQNKMLKAAGIPLPDFKNVASIDDIYDYIKDRGFKGMLKSRLGGYDGKGNALINSEGDVEEAYSTLSSGGYLLMIEEFIPFVKEISVLATRGINGDIAIYPVGENIHKNSILDETIVPARVGKEVQKKAHDIARRVMEVFEGVGMFCVELFVTASGKVLVNEVAPRPHNSGHYTIEGCLTSQFEQHIRAIVGLPLGHVDLIGPCVMKNLLGQEGEFGKTRVEGLMECLSEPQLKLHLYGKEETKAFRKMGHLTVLSSSVDEALSKARIGFNQIKIMAEKG